MAKYSNKKDLIAGVISDFYTEINGIDWKDDNTCNVLFCEAVKQMAEFMSDKSEFGQDNKKEA